MTPQATTHECRHAAVQAGSDGSDRCSDAAAVSAAERRRTAADRASCGDALVSIARRPTLSGDRVGRR